MSATALEFRDVVVRAGSRRLLDVPTLRVASGGVVGLLGPNGAGKTTLLGVCLGLVTPAGGQVEVLGVNVRALDGSGLAGLRQRIGYVPQTLPAHSELPLTVREVVAIGRTARVGCWRRLSRADWRQVDHWLERLGLAALAGRAFRETSGGEQRKILLARAMAQEPELLLLDEPTANLDLGWRERIVETVEDLHREQRVSVVLVCHELEVLPPACRRVVLLNRGRLVAEGAPEQVFTPERVAALYGAGLQPLHANGRHALLPGRGPAAPVAASRPGCPEGGA
jgi:ABC-type cobalamin/Fe3+-siderophores transport system ATPase subunit